MRSQYAPGLIGAIAGSIIGILGGLVGTYFSIKNTNGPKERAFMIKVSMIGWIAILLFLVLLLYLPRPYNYFMWIPYGILLPLGILYTNRRQREIREEEKNS